MSDIIINPEYLKLIEDVKQLKEDIASLYEEKDELVYHICKNIEMGELEELKESKVKYETIINGLLDSIKQIKESFPYNKKEFLKSDILVQKRKRELEEEVEMYKEVYSNLENILKQLKGESNG